MLKPIKNDIARLGVVLAYGALLQFGRLYLDGYLRAHGAPDWTPWATFGGLAVLWLGGGNWLLHHLTPKEKREGDPGE